MLEDKIGTAAFQAFLNIAKKWRLNQEQERKLLGDIPRSTFSHWKVKVENSYPLKLPKDTLERISYILGIYKNIHILLSSSEEANNWVHKPNQAPLFNGESALNKMLAGNVVDLADVRRFLDAQRGT